MCGIFGSITKKGIELTPEQQAQRQNVVTALGFAMEERGNHSTGIGVIREGELYIKKRAIPAHDFLNSKKVKRLLRDNPSTVVGHTRWATTGARTDENAHPFLIGNICGVHNGQVSNFREISSELEVDSEAIFTALDECNGNYIDAFKMLTGSMAVVWLDIRDPYQLHLVSHTNPLAICRVKQLDTIFFCSTKEAMQIAIHAGFGYQHNDIFEPTADYVYTIDEQLGITKESVDFKSVYTPPVNNMTYGHGYEDDPDSPRSTGYDPDDGVAYTPMHVFKKANGEEQTTEEAVIEELNATVCEMCGRPHDRLSPKEKKHGILYNYSEDIWVCMSCSEDVVGDSMMYECISWEELIAEKVDLIEEELIQKEEDEEYDRLEAEELAQQEKEAKEERELAQQKKEEVEKIVQTKTVTELVGSSKMLPAPIEKEKKTKKKNDVIIATPRTEKKERHFFA